MSTPKQFNMLDHIECLNILKEEGSQYVCVCPACDGRRLTINKEKGAYQCWSGGCETKAIREKVAPWAEVRKREGRVQNQSSKPNKKQRNCPANQSDSAKKPLVQASITLATLPQPATDSPQSQKRGETVVTTYCYSPTQGVERIQYEDKSKPKGYNKTFRQWHFAEAGEEVPIWKKGKTVGHRPAQPKEKVYTKGNRPWSPYRLDEAVQAARDSGANAILVVEGEQAVEKYREIGLACITLQGSNWREPDILPMAEMLQAKNLSLVCHPDLDQTGEKKAQKLKDACDRTSTFCVVIAPKRIDPDLPESGDIVDIFAGGMDICDFKERLEKEIHRAIAEQVEAQNGFVTETLESPNISYTQQVVNTLYNDVPWICVEGILYKWLGTHYSVCEDAMERNRIQKFLNTVGKENKGGDISFPYATPSKVKDSLEWVKINFAVSVKVVNPPNYINCANGVLTFDWKTGIPKPVFTSPHDPEQHYFTYEPRVKYDPSADPTFCYQLLEVLDEPQRSMFLKLLGASLNLSEVRKVKGRIIRAALLKGDGNNGKDSLKAAIALIYSGRGMTSVTLADFKQYDEGKKFALAKLVNSRINWASENSPCVSIDNLEVLKAVITGDMIEIENKYEQGYESPPNTVLFFNINKVPKIHAGLEAIKSRYAVISFDKTFKPHPDLSKGELQADPRFKDNPIFMAEEVCPALLNLMIAALQDLVSDGIDYSSTEQALLNIQSANSHLHQFMQDVGLTNIEGSQVPIKKLWQTLEAWYISNEILRIETDNNGKEERIWTDQADPFDKNIKGSNQVTAQFTTLFPKVKRVHIGDNKFALEGLGFVHPALEVNQITPELSQGDSEKISQ